MRTHARIWSRNEVLPFIDKQSVDQKTAYTCQLGSTNFRNALLALAWPGEAGLADLDFEESRQGVQRGGNAYEDH